MNNWKMRLANWMRGRYGVDALYKGLIGLYFGLVVLNLFLRWRLFFVLSLAVLAYAMYRVFSRQLARRARENSVYLSVRDKARKKLLLTYNRVRLIRTHRYRTCPHCKTPLRLARKPGTMTVNCPVCHTTFQATIRF